MLIVLGGLTGSGRARMAGALASTYGLYRYDINSKKIPLPVFNSEGNLKAREPRNKAERLRVYDKALKDLPFLSKMHEKILIDDTFHRQVPREYFLKKAGEFCAPVVFVWIEADDEHFRVNAQRLFERGAVKSVEGVLQYRELHKHMVQLDDSSVLRFQTTAMDSQQVEDLWELIQRSAN